MREPIDIEKRIPGRPARRRRRLLAACVLGCGALLVPALTAGSLLFRLAATAALPADSGCRLLLRGPRIRPLGFFAFGSWELRRGGQAVFVGRGVSGSCRPGAPLRFRLSVSGGGVRSGPAFPGLFPAHNEKIPDFELDRFDLQASAAGLSRAGIRRSLRSRLDLSVLSISLESSRLCRKIQEATGIRIQRYLRFDGGRILLVQEGDRLSIRTPRPLDGPYQILDLDGATSLESRRIDLKMTFGLQPRLVRRLQRRSFFKPFIADDWDRRSIVMLPAPIVVSGTVGQPRIDLGGLIRSAAASRRGGSPVPEGPEGRVHLRLQRRRDGGGYRLAAPAAPAPAEASL